MAAASDFRCGSILIVPGDNTTKVSEACGAPQSIRKSIVRIPRKGSRYQYEIHFEVWSYDRGPYEFVRSLTFREGILERVEEGTYGGGNTPR